MTQPVTFDGILPALITPFTPDGSALDGAAMAAQVDRCIAAGVVGLVATGSTGEFPTLSNAERRAALESVIAAAAGRVPTVASTGALSTAETIELSVHAEAAGAAAVMIVPPFYTPLLWREVLAHYAAVAERISIPIMYYNLPAASGISLSPERLEELGRVGGVTMLKDTGGDAIAATAFIQAGAALPTLLNGYDTMTFAALAAGVRGVVWGAASFIPGPCVELHRRLAVEGDLAGARELWSRIWPVCDALEAMSYPAAVKAGCAHVGLATGPVRAPLLEITPAERSRLTALIDALEPAAVRG